MLINLHKNEASSPCFFDNQNGWIAGYGGNVLRITVAYALIVMLLQSGCKDLGVLPDGKDNHKLSECLSDRYPIDTARVYLWPTSRDTLTIYPKAVFARFYPWVRDTSQIVTLAARHNLRLLRTLFTLDGQLAGVFCITDGRRAEYHFTPWGKQPWNSFGADSLVEYCFGVFDEGYHIPYGTIDFEFVDGTPRGKIDSLFNEHGLWLIRTTSDPFGRAYYYTLVTPSAAKNDLDLACELQYVPYVRTLTIGIAFAMSPARCE